MRTSHFELRVVHLAACLVGLLFFASRPAVAQSRAVTAFASGTAVYAFELAPGNSAWFELRNVVPATASARFIIARAGAGSAVTQVAVATSGTGACPACRTVSYTQPSNRPTETYLAVLVASTTTSAGVGDLFTSRFGAGLGPIASSFVFGRSPNVVPTLTVASGNTLAAVPQPGEAMNPIFLGWSSTGTLERVAAGGLAGRGTLLGWTSSMTNLTVGAAAFGQTGSTLGESRVGTVRVLSNDATDADGDGLGNALEAALGTCAGPAPCHPTWLFAATDTDNDGLSDRDEVLGTIPTGPSDTGALALPRWGADPLTKDIFIEMDFVEEVACNMATLTPTDPDVWLAARNWTNLLSGVADLYAPATANEVRNPSGASGIRLHFDAGVEPPDVADEALFGDWSDSDRFEQLDASVSVVGSVPGGSLVELTVGDNEWTTTVVASGWSDVLFVNLLRLLIPALDPNVDVTTPNVPAGQPALAEFAATNACGFAVNGDASLQLSVTVPQGTTPPTVTAQREQLEQIRDLRYLNAAQFAPRRRSVFHLGTFSNDNGGQSGVGDRTFQAGINSAQTIAHELGHSLGLRHSGHPGWGGASVNCSPFYVSTMNYASGNSPFLQTTTAGGVQVNPTAVSETNPLGGAATVAAFASSFVTLGITFQSAPDGVDWNRNGVPSDPQTWRTPVNNTPWTGCLSMTTGRTDITSGLAPEGPASIVRSGSRLYVFWTSGGFVRYRHAQLAQTGSLFHCHSLGLTTPGSCVPTWATASTLTSGSTVLAGQNVTAIAHNGSIYAAYQPSANLTEVVRLTVGSGGVLSVAQRWGPWFIPTELPLRLARFYVPTVPGDLATKTPRLQLLYIDSTNDRLRSKQLDTAETTWALPTNVIDTATGAPILAAVGVAAVEYPLPGTPGVANAARRACLAVPGPIPSGDTRAPISVFCATNDGTSFTDITAQVLPAPGTQPRVGPNDCRGASEVEVLGTTTVCQPYTDTVPDFEFRPMRRTDGSWPNGAGHFVLVWGREVGTYRPSEGCWSQPFTSSEFPGVTPNRRLNWWCGPSDDDWQNLTAPTVTSPRNSGNEDYLFDAFIRGGFGVATRLWEDNTDPQLRFAPYADGVFDATLKVGNDFRVMQDYVACSVTELLTDCPSDQVVNVVD